jgi:hypothetical protein
MQDMRFYLLIETNEKGSDVRIDGNLETFRDLLQILRADLTPVTTLLAEDPKPAQRESCATA